MRKVWNWQTIVRGDTAMLNEESRDHAILLLCRGPRRPWPEIWPRLRSFG